MGHLFPLSNVIRKIFREESCEQIHKLNYRLCLSENHVHIEKRKKELLGAGNCLLFIYSELEFLVAYRCHFKTSCKYCCPSEKPIGTEAFSCYPVRWIEKPQTQFRCTSGQICQKCTNAQHSLRNNSGIPDTSQIHINKYTEAKKHDIKGAENVCMSRHKIFTAFKFKFATVFAR